MLRAQIYLPLEPMSRKMLQKVQNTGAMAWRFYGCFNNFAFPLPIYFGRG